MSKMTLEEAARAARAAADRALLPLEEPTRSRGAREIMESCRRIADAEPVPVAVIITGTDYPRGRLYMVSLTQKDGRRPTPADVDRVTGALPDLECEPAEWRTAEGWVSAGFSARRKS
jgi:hypothetical protein